VKHAQLLIRLLNAMDCCLLHAVRYSWIAEATTLLKKKGKRSVRRGGTKGRKERLLFDGYFTQ
jgi:hypothetical protein